MAHAREAKAVFRFFRHGEVAEGRVGIEVELAPTDLRERPSAAAESRGFAIPHLCALGRVQQRLLNLRFTIMSVRLRNHGQATYEGNTGNDCGEQEWQHLLIAHNELTHNPKLEVLKHRKNL